MMRRALLAALAVTALAAAGVTEPEGYREAPYRAPVPATLQGATVVDIDEAQRLWEAGDAAFVDVLPRTPRPPDLPEGTLWHEAEHRTIAKAVWLPNVGFAALPQDDENYLREALASPELRDRPIVVFCLTNCWMSWNAAKRAIEFGHPDVRWFPGGADTWEEAGLPMEVVQPFAP